MNRVSVIVPVYRVEAYLCRCLDSILAQTYTDLEVILVDDGSPDGCPAICDDYARRDPRVRVIHQANGGVTRARFAGIRAATGDWIGFVDGDDYIESDMYRQLMDNARKYNVDISHCGYRMVFPNREDYYYNSGQLREQDRTGGLKDLLEGSQVEPGLCNKLYRRSLIQPLLDSGLEEMGIRINEDLLMNYYLFSAAERSVFEDVCPYHYIVRTGSAANTRNRECHVTDPIRVGSILCKETEGNAVLQPYAMRLYARRLISGVTQKSFPELAKNAKRELRKLNKRLLPRKERYMAILAAYCLPLYRLARWGYGMITGVDHKYDLE